MEPPYNPKYPQKVVVPPGYFNPDENTIIDLPGQDEEIFVASKPKGQRPPVSSKTRPPGSPRPRPDPPHTPHSLVTVGPDPDELETREQQNLEDDLKSFHGARRKLFYDVLTLQVTRLKKGVKKHLQKE